jgi:hypothetical protein
MFQIVLPQLLAAADTFRDILSRHFDMNPTGVSAHLFVNGKKFPDFL